MGSMRVHSAFFFFWQVGDAVVLSLFHVFVSHICLLVKLNRVILNHETETEY